MTTVRLHRPHRHNARTGKMQTPTRECPADSIGPSAATTTKRQIANDPPRSDPAASVVDSLGLLDDKATGTDEHPKGVGALIEKRPPDF